MLLIGTLGSIDMANIKHKQMLLSELTRRYRRRYYSFHKLLEWL